MEFEQAIYTRGKNLLYDTKIREGLGIVATSKEEKDFVVICRRIGSNFRSEWSEKTAQVVIYSEEFDTYVGVGISPAANSDGGGANILCHMFVPVEGKRGGEWLSKPENYYLNYPFKKMPVTVSHLDRVELYPFWRISKDNYKDILKKYHMDQKKLAYFLYKIYPILFADRKFLLIILDPYKWEGEEHSTIAREITSLANYLAPGKDFSGVEYRKRLSYSVNAKRNVGVVNIAYSSDENILSESRFYLGRQPEEDVPEVYLALAEKALESLDAYQNTIYEILNYEVDNVNTRKLAERFFWWKIKCGQRVDESEAPYQIETMIKRASKNQNDREQFMKYILLVDDLKIAELRYIWETFVQTGLYEETISDSMLKVVKRIVLLTFEKNKKEYQLFLEKLPEKIQTDIIEELYSQDDSCIKRHFRKIQTFEEYWNLIELYRCLNKNLEYIDFIRHLDFAKEIPEKIRSSVFSYLEICTDKEKRPQANGLLWEHCKGDISSRIFCSWLFGAHKYSIWEDFNIGDIEEYKKIRTEINNKNYLQKIEEMSLEKENNRKAELNRVCYCLWKQVTENEDCDLHRLEIFKPNEFQKEIEDFLTSLELFVVERAKDKDCIIYLKLELKKEELCSKRFGRSSSESYEKYISLKRESPQFYEKLLKVPYNGKDSSIMEKIQDIKKYDAESRKANLGQGDRKDKIINRITGTVEVQDEGAKLNREEWNKMKNEVCEIKEKYQKIENELSEMKNEREVMSKILHELRRQVNELNHKKNGQLMPIQSNLLPDSQDSYGNTCILETKKEDKIIRENPDWYRN